MQFNSKNKDEIRSILAARNIDTIEFDHIGPDGTKVRGRCVLDDMRTGWPSKEQLIQGGTAALKEIDAHLGSALWNPREESGVLMTVQV